MSISAIREVEQAVSLRDCVGRSLSAAIISGELAPGALVSVPALASQFDVSATPVREAMLDLVRRGFVERVRNKGFRVIEVGEQDLREIVELRKLLEAPTMRRLVGTIPAEAMSHWRSVADQIALHADTMNLAGFIDFDRDFHLGLLDLHGNGRLVGLVRELRLHTRMVNLARMARTDLAEAAREHHVMLNLLEREDGEALEEMTRQHIEHVIDRWGGGATQAR